jgi:hypothetical protein
MNDNEKMVNKIIMGAAFLVAFFVYGTCKAEVTQLSLELKRMPYQREPFFPDQTEWGHEVALHWDVRLGRFFLENETWGQTYDSVFKYMGWQYNMGLTVTPWLDLVWDHHSRHALDADMGRFPVSDAYGIRLNFLGEKK